MSCLPMRFCSRSFLFVLLALLPLSAAAHPAPEISVKGDLKSDGAATLTVIVDPRCFRKDAAHAPYLKQRDLERLSKDDRAAYFEKAKQLIANTLRFHLKPSQGEELDFDYRFEKKPNAPPDSDGGTPVFVVAVWKAKPAEKLASYQVEALKVGKFGVRCLNTLDGKKQKLSVLFPGEKSDRLAVSRAVEQ